MAVTIQSIVAETKRNKLSLIGALTENDVLLVWDKVAEIVETLMLRRKGVSITGLGVFTFSQRKIDVGNNKSILIRRPVFVLSEKFAQTHSLHCVKQHTSGQIPLHPLNYTVLSNETALSREMVEGGVREVLQALSRSVAAKKSVEFDLKDIGRLVIQDGKARMSFFREFVLRLDGSTDFESAFRLSTGSSVGSIMSKPDSPSRPSTSLSLPRIVQPCDDTNGLSLSLECSGDSNTLSPRPLTSASDALSFSYGSTRQSRRLEKGKLRSLHMSTITEEGDKETEEERGEDEERETEGVCTVDRKGKIVPTMVKKTPLAGKSDQSKSPNASRSLAPKPAMLFVGQGSNRGSPPPPTGAGRKGHSSMSGARDRLRSKRTASRNATADEGTCSCSMYSTDESRPSTCSHKGSSGQELCYLCHQRAVNNVPVDLTEERAVMEKWHSETLQEYQRRRELLGMARTQASKTKNRLISQDIATFNQSRAENIKKQKTAKSSSVDPSYVFCDRSPTPAPHMQQQRYCSDLDGQVALKHHRKNREREEEEKTGKEEQERLAKELAAYETLYQKMKAMNVNEYKSALEEQVALKTECDRHYSGKHDSSSSRHAQRSHTHTSSSRHHLVPSPTTLRPFACSIKTHSTHKDTKTRATRLKPLEAMSAADVSSSPAATTQQQQQPVFGVHNMWEETEKKRAKAFFMDQLTMVSDKQRREKERGLRTLQEEVNMLKKTKDGLKTDLQKERGKRVRARQDVEQEWLYSMGEKQEQLLDELHRAREHGLLLHQQCEKYQRCKQCQRRRHNVGKSNILRETRYISGARLMV